MKKLLALVLVLSLSASAFAYNPGVYTSKAKGNNPDVPVEVQVTFDGDKITDIKILAHDETKGLGDKAFEKVTA